MDQNWCKHNNQGC